MGGSFQPKPPTSSENSSSNSSDRQPSETSGDKMSTRSSTVQSVEADDNSMPSINDSEDRNNDEERVSESPPVLEQIPAEFRHSSVRESSNIVNSNNSYDGAPQGSIPGTVHLAQYPCTTTATVQHTATIAGLAHGVNVQQIGGHHQQPVAATLQTIHPLGSVQTLQPGGTIQAVQTLHPGQATPVHMPINSPVYMTPVNKPDNSR